MKAPSNPDAEGDIGSNVGEVSMPKMKASTEPDLNKEKEISDEDGEEEEKEVVVENTGNPGAVYESADDSHVEQGEDSKTDELTKVPFQLNEGFTTNMTRKRTASIASSEDGPKRIQGRNVPAGVGIEQQKDAAHKSYGAAGNEKITPANHLSDGPHGCPLCSEYFELIQDLYSHLEEHQDIDSVRQQKSKPERHRCLSCSLDFFTRPTFINHLKTHNAASNPFSCSYCPQSFPKQWYLKRHLLLHTKEKKFSCDSCGRPFSRKDHLQDHSRRCSGKRKINKCPECPSKFATRSELYMHKIKVHGLKTDFYCFLCRLFFPNEPSLDRHLLTHKLMKFYCKKCDRHFNTDKELIMHSRKIP